ncbi:hypothetical protein GGF42_004900, partial [Coemansia sp. RSA 2424]
YKGTYSSDGFKGFDADPDRGLGNPILNYIVTDYLQDLCMHVTRNVPELVYWYAKAKLTQRLLCKLGHIKAGVHSSKDSGAHLTSSSDMDFAGGSDTHQAGGFDPHLAGGSGGALLAGSFGMDLDGGFGMDLDGGFGVDLDGGSTYLAGGYGADLVSSSDAHLANDLQQLTRRAQFYNGPNLRIRLLESQAKSEANFRAKAIRSKLRKPWHECNDADWDEFGKSAAAILNMRVDKRVDAGIPFMFKLIRQLSGLGCHRTMSLVPLYTAAAKYLTFDTEGLYELVSLAEWVQKMRISQLQKRVDELNAVKQWSRPPAHTSELRRVNGELQSAKRKHAATNLKSFRLKDIEHWMSAFHIPKQLIPQPGERTVLGKEYFNFLLRTDGVGISLTTVHWESHRRIGNVKDCPGCMADRCDPDACEAATCVPDACEAATCVPDACVSPICLVAKEARILRHCLQYGQGGKHGNGNWQGKHANSSARDTVNIPPQARGKIWIGLDPGRRDVYTAACLNERNWSRSLSAKQYYHEFGINARHQQMDAKIDRIPGLRDWMTRSPTCKTASSAQTLRHLRYIYKSKMYMVHAAIHKQLSTRILRWVSYKKRQQALAAACRRLTVGLDRRKTVFCIGDGGYPSNAKGCISVPHMKIFADFLKQDGWTVIPVGEHNTSQVCSACHHGLPAGAEPLKMCGLNEDADRFSHDYKAKKKHFVRRCTNPSCQIIWNRDTNAALNIAFLGMLSFYSDQQDLPDRPFYFRKKLAEPAPVPPGTSGNGLLRRAELHSIYMADYQKSEIDAKMTSPAAAAASALLESSTPLEVPRRELVRSKRLRSALLSSSGQPTAAPFAGFIPLPTLHEMRTLENEPKTGKHRKSDGALLAAPSSNHSNGSAAAVRIANIDNGRRPKNLVERNSKRKAESER